jgi:hypothetical protein
LTTTELVAATTDEITMTAGAARDITDKIKAGVEAVWELITHAYTSRAWVALGYSSWDDYCTNEFGTSRIRLPREERAEKVLSLRESGLSLRAIESATGISRPTIIKDLKNTQVVNSLPPEPPGAVTDSTPGDTDRVQAILEKVRAAQAAEPVDVEMVPVVEPVPPSVKTDVADRDNIDELVDWQLTKSRSPRRSGTRRQRSTSTPSVQNRTVEPVPVSKPKIVGVDGKAYTAKKKTDKAATTSELDAQRKTLMKAINLTGQAQEAISLTELDPGITAEEAGRYADSLKKQLKHLLALYDRLAVRAAGN